MYDEDKITLSPSLSSSTSQSIVSVTRLPTMGAPEAPYLYSPPSHAGFDFNPRAYSQAAYAASVQSSSPRPKQNGPLVDLNRHPDSWMPVTPSLQEYKPLPDNMRAKIITCRGIQFALRLPELLGALGLLVCAISFQGMQATQGWIVRIPVSTTLPLLECNHL